MGKQKYQIELKSAVLSLKVIQRDLVCHLDELMKDPTDLKSLISKLRSVRDVSIQLNNLRDHTSGRLFQGKQQLVDDARVLRKQLEFFRRVRNISVGHIDPTLSERAVQWHPQIFSESTKEREEFRTFLCFRALIESSINAALTEDGYEKPFKTEIDLFYPPDWNALLNFLVSAISASIKWIQNAVVQFENEIDFTSDEMMIELASVAGKTNFDLKKNSEFDFSPEETKLALRSTIEHFKEMEVDQKIIDLLESLFEKR